MKSRKKWIAAAATGLALCLVPFSLALGEGGTADGGGDFAYYHSGVRLHQQQVAGDLAYMASKTPQEFFDEVFAPYKVNRERLVSILSHVEERLTENKYRKNPAGQLEPLLLDFGLNEKGEEAIFILAGFYDWAVRQLERPGNDFEKFEIEKRLEKEMSLKLFKEALHHFGIINDDLAQKYALYSEQFNSLPMLQIRDCQELEAQYPDHVCLKSWQKEYWQVAKQIEEWESGKLGSGTVIFASKGGLLLEFDLSKKKQVSVHEPRYGIHGIGKCVERTYERSDCVIKKELKDGKTHSLSSSYRIYLSYQKQNDFEIPLAARAPFEVAYQVGGDFDDEHRINKEFKVILKRRAP